MPLQCSWRTGRRRLVRINSSYSAYLSAGCWPCAGEFYMEKNLAALSAQNDSLLDMPAHAASAASPLRSWLSVVSVAIGAFAFVTTEFLPVGLLPQIASDLGVSPGTAGLMVTTPGIIAAISAPGLMLGAGRIDRRFILLALSILLLTSNLVSAFAP